MNKKKGIFLVLLTLIIFSLLIIASQNFRENLGKIFANINDYQVRVFDNYKNYDLNSIVYYNPVSNSWCESEDIENNCFSWIIISENEDKLELFYKDDVNHVSSALASGEKTLEEELSEITSSWSNDLHITNEDKIKVTSSYPAPLTQYPTKVIDFSLSKARIIFDDEITNNLMYVFKDNNICGTSSIPCISILKLKEENAYNYNKWGIINAASNSHSGMGGIQVSNPSINFYIHPVIEVKKQTYKINTTLKEVYDEERNYLAGVIGVVYLDPTDLTKTCIKEDADNNVNNYNTPTTIKTGCMKWYIIGENNSSYTLILNHNTSVVTKYSSTGKSSNPDIVNNKLKEDTSNWKIDSRLIRISDIADVVGIKYDSNVPNNVYEPYNGHYGSYSAGTYAHLSDYNGNTRGLSYPDSNKYQYTSLNFSGQTSTCGYWTSSVNNSTSVFTVDETGTLTYKNASSDTCIGIRPLITLPKELFYEGLTITFVDGDSVTVTKSRYNSKINSIPEKGMDGYLFDYWSLEKDGGPFDFSQNVTEDTTVYAVYKKRNCITEEYSLGQVVYFDPVTYDKCNESTFDINKIKNGTSTCYRWRVISINDSIEKNNYDIMLDHNLENISENFRSNDNVFLPDKLFQTLSSLTSNWTKVNNLNYSYDATSYPLEDRNNYGYLRCTDGLCEVIKGDNVVTLSSNVKSRIITAEEIDNMIRTLDDRKVNMEYNHSLTYTREALPLFKYSISRDNASIETINFISNGNYNNIGVVGNDDRLKWLSENTTSSSNGSTDNLYDENNYGYYTLTPNRLKKDMIWVVGNNDIHSIYPYINKDASVGIRPVINIEKENTCKKILVTYNDEERISTSELEVGDKALDKESQGKTGYTFTHWSLEKDGEAFDFNTNLYKNTIVYAVYEINKYNVEFYDDDEKIKTIVVEYNNMIDSTKVPTLTKEGYTFTYFSEKDKEESFDFTTLITNDLKLYSNYKIIDNEVIFNDENRITSKTINFKNKVEPIDSKGKIGHNFKYWSLEKNGEAFDFNTLIIKPTTLYAVYEIKKYKIEFYDDDNLNSVLKVNYNEKIEKDEIPKVSKNNYKFIGWFEKDKEEAFDFDVSITKNYKLYSRYEEIKECILSLTSNMYIVDNENLTISNVPEKAEKEEIEKQLVIKANTYEITYDNVIIKCDDKVKVYKINRIWLPQTGNIVIKYLKIIGYLSIIIVLLIVINKQRQINQRLHK